MSAPQREQLVDSYGRVHRDLRISVTDRCSLRCTYCMPEEGVPWLARPTMLTTEEVVQLAGVAVSMGIEEIRLTGGEPLLRRDLVDVVAGLAALDYLGYGLPASAPSLGELALVGKQNLQAPWLAFTAFFAFAIMLSLLVFIFEGIRDAFDARKTFS